MPVDIVLGAVALGTVAYGAYEKDQASKNAKKNIMPKYQIPQSETDNMNLAQSQANNGIGAAANQAYLNQANGGLAATENAILMGGGDPNAQSAAYDRYNTGIQNLSIYNDQARQAHLAGLSGAYSRASASADKSYQINELVPWENRAQLYAAQAAGANQTIGQGIGMFGKAAAGAAGNIGNGSDDTVTNTPYPYGQGNSNAGQGSPYQFGNNNAGSNLTNNFAGAGQEGSFNWNGYMPMYQ